MRISPARISAAMPTFTLPDGAEKRFSTAVDGLTIAGAIGQRLAKDAVAIEEHGGYTFSGQMASERAER